jgi:hypothetical protein
LDRSPYARLEDRLGPNEPAYRSRGEAQVGRLLDRYGLPFFYECPTSVCDRGRHRIWHPDFTLPTQGYLIVEYAGMPDRPEYVAGLRYKARVYRANQLPALFVYPTDLQGRTWPERLVQRIENAGRRATSGGRGYGLPRAGPSYRSAKRY